MSVKPPKETDVTENQEEQTETATKATATRTPPAVEEETTSAETNDTGIETAIANGTGKGIEKETELKIETTSEEEMTTIVITITTTDPSTTVPMNPGVVVDHHITAMVWGALDQGTVVDTVVHREVIAAAERTVMTLEVALVVVVEEVTEVLGDHIASRRLDCEA